MSLPPAAPAPSSPAATRLRAAAWKDPRLILGVVLVTGSVLLGSLVLAGADDTVAVWGARRTLPAGAQVTAADVDRRQVRLAGPDLGRYLLAGSTTPVGRRLDREVGAGELLPAAAIAAGSEAGGVQVPLTLAVGDLPEAIRVGSVVDVWAVPADGAGGRSTGAVAARRVLRQVVVAALSRPDDPLAPATTRSIVVLVPPATDLAEVLGAVAGARILITLGAGR